MYDQDENGVAKLECRLAADILSICNKRNVSSFFEFTKSMRLGSTNIFRLGFQYFSSSKSAPDGLPFLHLDRSVLDFRIKKTLKA